MNMEWILYGGKTFRFHTDLKTLLEPIKEDIAEFKWFMSDLDYIANSLDIPLNFDQDYFILDKYEFKKLLSHDIQFIWGSILGFFDKTEILFNPDSIPYVEDNDYIWESGNIQIPEAVIKIDCFDSSTTIVKFSNESLSKKFHNLYPEFIPLNKFKR